MFERTMWAGLIAVWVLLGAGFCRVSDFLYSFDDSPLLLGTNNSSPIVVVPGAWRQDNLPSHAFKLRAERAVEVAVACGSRYLIFTGGKGDAVMIRQWVVERFAVQAIDEELQARLAEDPIVEVEVHRHGRSDALLGSPLPSLCDDGRNSPSTRAVVALVIESASRTTMENAGYAARIIRSLGHESGSVVVVSSPWHLARCKVLFALALENSSVFVVPSHEHEAEPSQSPWPQWRSLEFQPWPPEAGRPVQVFRATEAPAEATPLYNFTAHPLLVAIPHRVTLLAHESVYFSKRVALKMYSAAWTAWSGTVVLRELVALSKNLFQGYFVPVDFAKYAL